MGKNLINNNTQWIFLKLLRLWKAGCVGGTLQGIGNPGKVNPGPQPHHLPGRKKNKQKITVCNLCSERGVGEGFMEVVMIIAFHIVSIRVGAQWACSASCVGNQGVHCL